MEPELLGTRWRHKRTGRECLVVRSVTENMASRCKSGETAYLWGWSDARDAYHLISPNQPVSSNEATFSMRIPLTVVMEDHTERFGVIVIYQDQTDNRLWASYSNEFLDGRFERLND